MISRTKNNFLISVSLRYVWWGKETKIYCIQGYFQPMLFSPFINCKWFWIHPETMLSRKRDNLRHWNSPSLKFPHQQWGRKGQKQTGERLFSCIQYMFGIHTCFQQHPHRSKPLIHCLHSWPIEHHDPDGKWIMQYQYLILFSMMKNSNKAVNRVQRAVNIKLIKFFKSLSMIELTDNTKKSLTLACWKSSMGTWWKL